jgi:hypothetical protein
MGGRGMRQYGKVIWPGVNAVHQRHVAKVGRNDPCPCGSNKKYKDCHEKAGAAFLEKVAREQDRVKRAEARAEAGKPPTPWYKRILGRS